MPIEPEKYDQGAWTKCVWLVRHAESEANAGERTTNPDAIGLTEKGKSQAEYIATAITTQPQRIVSSPYLRAKQTALPTLEKFKPARQEEWLVYEFTYLAVERVANLTQQERQPFAVGYWDRNDPIYRDGNGAESFVDFMGRVGNFIERIKTLDDDFVAVFGHGLFIYATLWRLLTKQEGLSAQEMARFRRFVESFEIPNAAIIRLNVERGGQIYIGAMESGHIPADIAT